MGLIKEVKTLVNDYIVRKEVNRMLENYQNNLYQRSNLSTNKDASSPTRSSGSAIVVGLAKRLGLRFGDLTSKDFEEPEFDLMDIDSAYDTDAYVRQGVDKYIEQIFKEGYGFYGKNPSALEYIKLRFKYIEEATLVPTDQLFTEIAEDIVKYSNATIVKARLSDQTQLPQGTTVAGVNGLEPVVGYFCLHPGTMKLKRDKNGLVKGWQQEVEGGDKAVKFKPEDVVHIYYKRKKGNAYGTPFLLPVLDDIRALRFLEENCMNMVYKHVNPLLHAKVGTKENTGSPTEIDDVRRDFEGMEPGGGLVTSDRVTIETVQTNNSVDAKPYLEYAEARVFSGLGIPAVKFGRGGTANRNTADSMTDEMSDRIKAFQSCIETNINFFIVKELLIEGGFDPINNPDDVIKFEFLENDMDRKIKSEAHATFLFEHKAIDENEMRSEIGREPIVDRALMYDTLYPNIKATDGGGSASKGKETDNKVKPKNQHGTKTSPKKTTNTHILLAILNNDTSSLKLLLNIDDVLANTIVHMFKHQIDSEKLTNEMYIELMNDRVHNIASLRNGGKLNERNNR